MTEHDDPLWNPDASADEDLARIQRLLGRYGVRARELPMPVIDIPRRRRRALPWALAAGIALVLLGGGYQYRLAWTPGSSWTAVRSDGTAIESETQLAPGQSLSTAPKESATIEVARIGSIALSPDSSIRLVRTEAGKHRVALEHGHMRARIWAPPGYFAVRADGAEVVDLGCDFDLWKDRDGSGRVLVRSGWVSYRIGSDDILVPEGYAMSFADGRARTPLRTDAPADFARAVHALETAIASERSISPAVEDAARRVAEAARDRDSFTLLSMLTRWPLLARTTLYPRLVQHLVWEVVVPTIGKLGRPETRTRSMRGGNRYLDSPSNGGPTGRMHWDRAGCGLSALGRDSVMLQDCGQWFAIFVVRVILF